jgi:glycosyltransferase involved in cell wall biosynthesis
MSSRLVSVIVTTKNSSASLGNCLQSITNQTYANVELIVVDNFSSDATLAIAKKYTNHFYSLGPERSTQRNYGAKKAKGVYVFFIDSDMELHPKIVEQCVKTIESNSNIVGVIAPEESFGEGFWAQCKRLERSFYVGVPYMEAARFFKKSDFQKQGGYDENMISGEDWDVSQRIGKKGLYGRTKNFIRHNEGRISLLKTLKKKSYYAKIFARYAKEPRNNEAVSQQTSVIGRYVLFFKHPVKLFKNPLLGIGMLFMKTSEFAFGGFSYLASRKGK